MGKKPDAEHVFDNLAQPLKTSITNLFFGISAVGEGAKVFGPPTETFFPAPRISAELLQEVGGTLERCAHGPRISSRWCLNSTCRAASPPTTSVFLLPVETWTGVTQLIQHCMIAR